MEDDNDVLLFECGICMENKNIDNINFLPCIHFLCSSCLDKLRKNECPYCRNKISEIQEDSYDETENEYNDVNFEIIVLEEDRRNSRKQKKNKKREKKIMKLLHNKSETIVSVRYNSYTILRNNIIQ
jgi:hypothetical protein